MYTEIVVNKLHHKMESIYRAGIAETKKYEYCRGAWCNVQVDCLELLIEKINKRYPKTISEYNVREITKEIQLIMNHITEESLGYEKVIKHAIIVFGYAVDNVLTDLKENEHEQV